MALAESTISNTKIKFKYGEPYTSEAANIQAGVNLPGAYRGGNVVVGTDSPCRSVRITTDGVATLILHRDPVSTASTVVLETGIVTLDLSGQTWPIPAGGVEWYVYMTVDYDLNADTTGAFGVDVVGNVPAGAVILAVVELAESASEITSADIKTDGSKRDKVLDKKYMRVQKLINVAAGSASGGRFQINDRVCYFDDTTFAAGNKAVSLRDHDTPYKPLVDSDGGILFSSYWYTASSGGSAITTSDLDEDGCYTGPWIQVYNSGGAITYSGDFRVAYYTVVSLDSVDTTEDALGFYGDHADDVLTGAVTGTVDSLVKGTVTSQIAYLLGFVNNRIKSLTGAVASSTWTLLWRSNDSVLDVDVDRYTLSLYYNNVGLMLVMGGYVDGTNIEIPSGVAGTPVYAISVGEDGKYEYRIEYPPTGSSTVPISSTSSWTYYMRDTDTQKNIYNALKQYNFDEYASVTMDGVPSVGTNDRFIEVLKIAEDRVRVYYSAASDDSRIMVATGCYWNDATSLWVRSSTDVQNANLLIISRAGFSFRQKLSGDSDFATGWSDTTGWTYKWNLGTSGLTSCNGFSSDGDTSEIMIVPAKVVLTEDYVAHMVNNSYVGPTVMSAINFRMYRETEPVSGDFAFERVGTGSNTLSNYTVSQIDHYGAMVSVDVNLLASLDAIALVSMADPDQIVISGDGYEWAVGQLIALRRTDTAYSNVWRVLSFLETGGNTILTVDDFNGLNEVPLSISPVGSIYTLPQSKRGNELNCMFRAKLFTV